MLASPLSHHSIYNGFVPAFVRNKLIEMNLLLKQWFAKGVAKALGTLLIKSQLKPNFEISSHKFKNPLNIVNKFRIFQLEF